MPSSSLLLLLLVLLVRPTGAEPDGDCSDTFRPGHENFVLDAEDAVREGAALLATAQVRSAEACERVCCEDRRCNLALLEPRAADGHTCVLFNCVHRNRFVCRFVTHTGYRTYIRESTFLKYLRGPQGEGESDIRPQENKDAMGAP